MIEQFDFPFTRWNRERDDWGFNAHGDVEPTLEWIDDSDSQLERVFSINPGWHLFFDHVVSPRTFAFRKAIFHRADHPDAKWVYRSRGEVTWGFFDGTFLGEPLDLDQAAVLDAMVTRLRVLSDHAFHMLPRRQREWLERCRSSGESSDSALLRKDLRL